MKGLKRMLLGIAFLLVAVLGAILEGSELGVLMLVGGSTVGLLLCLCGFFDGAIAKLLGKISKLYSNEENE